MSYFTDDQISLLLKPIHPNRVLKLKGLSYVEGFDIRAELNRVFGFGRWSEETMDQVLVCETETNTKSGSKAWYVVYRTRVRLTVFAPDGELVTFYDGAHVGESTHPVRGEAHGNALTNSQTYALKRAAHNLGDQFGLSLYNKGSMEAIVRWTLVRPTQTVIDTENVPQIAPESQPEAPEPPEAKPAARNRNPGLPGKPLEWSTPEQFSALIAKAATRDDLNAIWKAAGAAGKLQSGGEFTIDGEVTATIQELLFRRADELVPAKSNGTGAGSPGEGAGENAGGE
jgi:hypothetical protein